MSYYHPDFGVFETYEGNEDSHVPKIIKDELDNVFDYKNDGLFHNLNGDRKQDKLETIYCKICGGNEFYVGSGLPGSYFTALKCKKCKWEACVHDG